jgi:hypothetical protein
MRTALVILLAVALSGYSIAQTQTTGNATASACSGAATGNNNNFVINCGIGAAQGAKMVELLNKIMLNHDMADVNAKLDQLLTIVAGLGPPKLIVDIPKELPPSKDGHPRMSVDFYTDRPDEGGQFGVVCDRACTPVDICTLTGTNSGALGHLIDQPEVAVFLFRRQFPALTVCTLSVESTDDKPIKIIGMKHLLITDGRTLVLNAVQPPARMVTGGSVMQ